MWWHGGWGGWLTMMIFMLAFWAGLIALVVWLIRSRTLDRPAEGQQRPTALEILDERFARGEIDRDEYESRRSVLRER